MTTGTPTAPPPTPAYQPSRRGFVPPVYPFDKLTEFVETASAHDGGAIDLSIGTPCDPPPDFVIEALGHSGAERGYPASVGSEELLEGAAAWMDRRLGVSISRSRIAACIGTKEFVAGAPQWLRLRSPERDTVLYPSLAYPTYEMGAILAGCRAVAVPARSDGTLDLGRVSPDDAGRALCLWVNSPGNPGGQLEDLGAIAKWGREHAVPVLSDECYVEFTWASGRQTILAHGDEGVIAVHSLSKRSNLAGARVGFYAGDEGLVKYFAAVRRHAGFMVPGPVQHAAARALMDDTHVELQRRIYLDRLATLASALRQAGLPVDLPGGSFYLWVPVPNEIAVTAKEGESPAFALTRWFAHKAGIIGSPGDAYGPDGRGHVRLAVVQPSERIALAGERLLSG